MPLSPWQATANTHLLRRPSDTQRQVWLSLLGGHYSFPLGPGAHNVSFVPPNSLCFPQSCGSSVIKFCCPPKGFSAPSPDPQVGKSDVWPRIFSTVQELLWYSCSLTCMGINFNVIASLLSSLCSFSFVPGHWVSLFGLFQHPPVDSCSKVVAVWVFSRKMSAHPTQPSCQFSL